MSQKTYDDALAAIGQYEETHRHPKRPRLEIGMPYDLFPKTGREATRLLCKEGWPEVYPLSERAGAYIVLDAHARVLYVGKADNFGRRLGGYFAYASDRTCKVKHKTWSEQPRYVVMVAVPTSSPFEAGALEGFLIDSLRPPDNILGKAELAEA
jgi:hypothetical protein